MRRRDSGITAAATKSSPAMAKGVRERMTMLPESLINKDVMGLGRNGRFDQADPLPYIQAFLTPLTCWKAVTISERFRNFLGTRTCGQRWFTRTF